MPVRGGAVALERPVVQLSVEIIVPLEYIGHPAVVADHSPVRAKIPLAVPGPLAYSA